MSIGTWLVTGCSTGFGRALAEALLARGADVAVTARRPATLDAIVAAYPDRALPLRLDVTDAGDIAAAIDAIHARFGVIDGLVNNAGYGGMTPIEEMPIDTARAMMETNLFGALALIKAVLPEMRGRRAGRIVNIGSVAGRIGFPALGGYCASKFALAGLTEALAAEVGALGIGVTLAELGPFATEFTRAMRVEMPVLPEYDLAALSRAAGTSHWGAGDDPRAGAEALLDAVLSPHPPLRLILGQHGIDVIARYAAMRSAERDHWLDASRLVPAGR